MSKQQDILAYINANINKEVKAAEIAQLLSCSVPTVSNFIKNNPSRFEKVGHGRYKIISTIQSITAETSIDMSAEITQEIPETPQPTPEQDVLAFLRNRPNSNNYL